MPVYNANRYVAEAIESVLSQTFDDFELIIVDDGSTDRSLRILRRFERQDRRVRLVSRPHTGYVVALNEMIALARGELLARLDADDVALPERFAIQFAYLRDHPEIICVGSQAHIIDEFGRILHNNHPGMSHEEIHEIALEGRCPLAHSSIMMRRESVVAVGGYRVEMQPAEDLDLWLRLAERGRMANLPDILIKYRIHSDSVSEKYQQTQLYRSKDASDQACDRLGIAHRYLLQPPWRLMDRDARFNEALHRGWSGVNNGDRRIGQDYGKKAIRLMPWRAEGWWLLRAAMLSARQRGEG
jgi:glycosyltransferase involved in cell wall biosynthesis